MFALICSKMAQNVCSFLFTAHTGKSCIGACVFMRPRVFLSCGPLNILLFCFRRLCWWGPPVSCLWLQVLLHHRCVRVIYQSKHPHTHCYWSDRWLHLFPNIEHWLPCKTSRFLSSSSNVYKVRFSEKTVKFVISGWKPAKAVLSTAVLTVCFRATVVWLWNRLLLFNSSNGRWKELRNEAIRC